MPFELSANCLSMNSYYDNRNLNMGNSKQRHAPRTLEAQREETQSRDPRAVLKATFGHDRFLPMQEEVIASTLAGRDSLVLMPTGSGKSLCYQLPALCLDGMTLVVSPLIALMQDQVGALRARGIAAAYINSTLTPAQARRVQAAAYQGNIDILYVAPERVAMPQFRDFLHALNLSLIAIDEAHCISEWGHDFRPDYRTLQTLRANFPAVPVVALTATATERVRLDILDQLRMPGATQFVASFNRPNLSYYVRPKRRSFAVLTDLLRKYRDGSAIIYRFSRQNTEALAAELRAAGFNALPYHAGLEDDVRRETQERFLHDDVPIIVATIAFGMGVDKPNIRLVVHYDLPKTIEGYYQETGRAGRDGLPSTCVLFYSYGDKINQTYFIDQIEDGAERAKAEDKLARMVAYGEATSCRRAFLLDYFGEKWQQENCGACDVCLAETEQQAAAHTFDGTEITQKVLSTIIRTGERFGANHVVDVLRGSRARKVLQFHHETLPVHGIARGYSKEELQDVIDQLIARDLIARDRERDFPTLYVTGKGKEFIKTGETVTLSGSAPPTAQAAEEPDATLFGALRALRHEIATELAVPAFVVFSDESLRQMATQLPTDPDSLLRVKGVGPRKLQEFGERFLAVIRRHAAESGRERPPASAERAVQPNGSSHPGRDRESFPRAYEKWQPAEEERLADLYNSGNSVTVIARELARPPSAIASRLRQCGIVTATRVPLSETERQTLALVQQGRGVAEIAARRSLATGTILSHLERIIETDEAVDIAHMLPSSERLTRIANAFREADCDFLLAPVKERLGADYSYEELRMVRLRLRQLQPDWERVFESQPHDT